MPRAAHRLMTHMALLAIVLLATLPTLGRVLSAPVSQPATMARAMLHLPAMDHGMAGMAHGDHGAMAMMPAMHRMPASHAARPSPPHVSQHPDGGDQHRGHGEGDCNYCPLLHSLLAMPGVALSAAEEASLPAPQFRMSAAALPWHYPSGLGSRGPPRIS